MIRAKLKCQMIHEFIWLELETHGGIKMNGRVSIGISLRYWNILLLDPKCLRQYTDNQLSLLILGDWSDRDQKWLQVEEKVKRAMGQNTLDDGEFWMEFFSDFCREFEEVSICTLGPDFNHDGIVDASQVRHAPCELRV